MRVPRLFTYPLSKTIECESWLPILLRMDGPHHCLFHHSSKTILIHEPRVLCITSIKKMILCFLFKPRRVIPIPQASTPLFLGFKNITQFCKELKFCQPLPFCFKKMLPECASDTLHGSLCHLVQSRTFLMDIIKTSQSGKYSKYLLDLTLFIRLFVFSK